MKRMDGVRPSRGQEHTVTSIFIDKKKIRGGYVVAASIDGKIITHTIMGDRPTEKAAKAALVMAYERSKNLG